MVGNRQNAVVTGAGAGLGSAIALEAARAGSTVVVADIDSDAGERTVHAIRESGREAVFVECDVSRDGQIERAIAASVGTFGGFNVLYNNAGIFPSTPLLELATNEWDRVMAVNVRGVFLGCQAAVREMKSHGGGAIVNVGSVLSVAADATLPAYTASKHAVLGLTRAVAIAHAADGIRCNCICPGDMATDAFTRYLAEQDDPRGARAEIEDSYRAKRIANPSEVARSAVFLASDAASFVNGAHLMVDGGLSVDLYGA